MKLRTEREREKTTTTRKEKLKKDEKNKAEPLVAQRQTITAKRIYAFLTPSTAGSELSASPVGPSGTESNDPPSAASRDVAVENSSNASPEVSCGGCLRFRAATSSPRAPAVSAWVSNWTVFCLFVLEHVAEGARKCIEANEILR